MSIWQPNCVQQAAVDCVPQLAVWQVSLVLGVPPAFWQFVAVCIEHPPEASQQATSLLEPHGFDEHDLLGWVIPPWLVHFVEEMSWQLPSLIQHA